MSYQAIAAALALEDVCSGERLTAFSLASFADRENRARPGTLAAAGRTGLKKSWFLEARDRLVERGLVVVERAGRGRGQASTLWLRFADAGPWWEGDVNAELFETVLGYGRAQGSARLLLAAMAALADEERIVEGVTAGQLCVAAGFSDKTYRRAQGALLASGELVVRRGSGGRGNTNVWEISDPRSLGAGAGGVGRRRVAPPPGQRPLVASVPAAPGCAVDRVDREDAVVADAAEGPALAVSSETSPASAGIPAGKGGAGRTVSAENGPVAAGVSVVNGGTQRTVSVSHCPAGAGVSEKGGAGRTLSSANRPAGAGVSRGKGGAGRTLPPSPAAETPAKTPAQTPAQTPAPNARAGREPQNPRTSPPSPPEGGAHADSIVIEETVLTDRGRRRPRRRVVELAPLRERLRAAGKGDRAAWQQIRQMLLEAIGENMFAIWLEPLELVAVDVDGVLVVSAPSATAAWVRERFGRLIAQCAERAGRLLRIADEAERKAAETLPAYGVSPVSQADGAASPDRDGDEPRLIALPVDRSAPADRWNAAGTSADRTAGPSAGGLPAGSSYASADESSYAHVNDPKREVSGW